MVWDHGEKLFPFLHFTWLSCARPYLQCISFRLQSYVYLAVSLTEHQWAESNVVQTFSCTVGLHCFLLSLSCAHPNFALDGESPPSRPHILRCEEGWEREKVKSYCMSRSQFYNPSGTHFWVNMHRIGLQFGKCLCIYSTPPIFCGCLVCFVFLVCMYIQPVKGPCCLLLIYYTICILFPATAWLQYF